MSEDPENKESQTNSTHHGHKKRRHMRIFGRHIPVPQSVAMRRTLGGALVAGGALGFLPVLGFWMVPLGLVVLSQDSALVRRKRRQIEVKLGRRWKSGWFASDKDKG
ncbi:hypothetical protein J2X72_001328 [Phyllobacterium sp. 1468]|nr:hypothetical protein [Phyllobacterium sp. 1468]